MQSIINKKTERSTSSEATRTVCVEERIKGAVTDIHARGIFDQDSPGGSIFDELPLKSVIENEKKKTTK